MAPASMRVSAMLRPRPRAPPVTMMTLPARLKRGRTLLACVAWALVAGACGVVWVVVSGIVVSPVVVSSEVLAVASETGAADVVASSGVASWMLGRIVRSSTVRSSISTSGIKSAGLMILVGGDCLR